MNLNNIKSYCIHLKNRKDREEKMYKNLNKFLPSKNYEIFDAIKHDIGKVGVSRSFKSIIHCAKEQNLDHVLIFEDDVRFQSEDNNATDYYNKCLETLPTDWDILLGGVYYAKDLNNTESDYIKHITDFSSLHCILIRNTVYDHILAHEEDGSNTIHLDRYLGNLSSMDKIKAYLCYPMVATQYNGLSDTIKGKTNYDKLLKKYKVLK